MSDAIWIAAVILAFVVGMLVGHYQHRYWQWSNPSAVALAKALRQLVNAPLPTDLDREHPFWVAARNARATLDTYADQTGIGGDR